MQTVKVGWKGGLSAIGIGILWGGNITAIKVTLEGVRPMMMAGLTFTLGALFILFWTAYSGVRIWPGRREIRDHLTNALLFTVQIVLFYKRADLTSASRAVVLTNTNIFFVAFLAHFFIPGDRLTTRKTLGLLLAFFGVIYLFLDRTSLHTGTSLQGDLIVLTSAFLLGVRIIYLKHLIQRIDPFKTVLWQMLIGAPIFFFLALLFEGTALDLHSARILGALLYQGIVVAGFTFMVSTLLLKRYSPTSLSVFFFAVPIAGVILSHWILNEAFTQHIVASVLLVAAGIWMVNFRGAATP